VRANLPRMIPPKPTTKSHSGEPKRHVFSLAEYTTFARQHLRFLAFGFFLCFTSSAGQTYFIGVFGPGIRESFGLDHTQWGGLYMLGTLGSALLLPWTGQLIDRFDLRVYVACVVFGLAVAALSISSSQSLAWLVFSIFLLRQFGQGLTSHASITSMARYMGADRGKGIAIASMGYSVGEAILPVAAVVAIATLGWRGAYSSAAVGVILMLAFCLWLLKGHGLRHRVYEKAQAKSTDGAFGPGMSRSELLRDRRFYLLLPAVLAPSFISTALFFHHLTLAESKAWSGLWVTGNYWVYASLSICTALVAGPFIDRYSAARIIPYYLTPMIFALLLLIPAQNPLWVLAYMVLLGMNTGVYFTAVNALWAELYGSRHLGAIKSLAGSFGVFASALGPVSIGILLDAGYSFEFVCGLFALFCLGATVLLVVGLRQYGR